MLKLISKLIVALFAVVLLLLGVAAIALPRVINTDEFHEVLRASAAQALGTPVEWSNVEAGLLPLRLIIAEPMVLAGSADREDARLTAKSIDLRLSALAFLARRIQVDSLVVHGLELVITRTRDGFVLPIRNGDAETDPASAPEPATSIPPPADGSNDADDAAFEIAIRKILISDSRLIVHDQTLPRPIEWRFEDIRFEAIGDSIEQPMTVEFSSRLANGERDIGGLTTSGRVSFAGVYDLEVGFEELLLAELQPYIADVTLSGALSGQVSIEGAGDVVSRVAVDLAVEDMRVKTFGLDLVGRLDLEARQTRKHPIEFEAALDLGAGGKVAMQGSMTLEGAVDARLALSSLEIEPFARLAGDEIAISGTASGRVELAASAADGLSHLTTDLKIENARYSDAVTDIGGALNLVLGLEGLGPDDPVRFDVGLAIDGGGHVDAEGMATLAGLIDAKIVLGGVALARVAAWMPEGTRVEGTLTGDADIRVTPERKIERLAAKLRIDSARFVSDPVDVAGAFDLELGLLGEGRIQLAAGLRLDDGSQLEVEGTSTVAGVVDLDATFESFDLALVAPFLPDPEMLLAGSASGTGRLVGEVTAPEFLSLDLGIEDGAFKTSEYSVEGPFLVTVKVKEPLSRPRGRIELDLTAARVQYLDQFTKRAGMRAEMTTRFMSEDSGEIIFESKLKLRDIDEILLQGVIGETTSISVTTPRFNLKGWSEVLPVLAEYEADGVIALDGVGVELIDGAPSRFGGRIALRGVGLTVPDAGRVRLRGSILGEGTRIRTKGLKALVAGATVGIQGAVEDPFGEGRFDLSIQTIGEVEVDDLLRELAGSGGILFGLLDLRGEVHGRWGAEEGLMESLVGDLHFTVGEKGGGRLRGVSLLQTILDQIPLLGGAARLSSPFRGDQSVDDYFEDRFEVIEGDLDLASGRVVARLLRLAYPAYEVRLTGPMRLRDLQIDMTGELLLKDDLASVVGGIAGARMDEREPIRIPLARVTNTLDDPHVEMTAATLAAIPKLLFQASGLDTLTLGIGKSLGEAIGRVLGDGN